ncbi:hypothetical protein [Nocardia sp. CS682]|uniref:hypothetical protein n=1 Tax=Nocardia sp. CS682 TaxID=1047172 RepID=UPI0010757E1D|nr:hypothetical protein [Nocardia sp. CS682]
MVPKAEAKLTAQLDGLSPDHPAALGAREELLADLRSVPGLYLEERGVAEHEGKGVLQELVIGFGGAAGSLAGLVKILQLWLSRDRHRSLTVSVSQHGTDKTVIIEGENISMDALTEALGSAAIEPDSQPRS